MMYNTSGHSFVFTDICGLSKNLKVSLLFFQRARRYGDFIDHKFCLYFNHTLLSFCLVAIYFLRFFSFVNIYALDGLNRYFVYFFTSSCNSPSITSSTFFSLNRSSEEGEV